APASDDLAARKRLGELAIRDARGWGHVNVRVDADLVPHIVDQRSLPLARGADLDLDLDVLARGVGQDPVCSAPPAVPLEGPKRAGAVVGIGVLEAVLDVRVQR